MIGVYVRVSTVGQNEAGQRREIKSRTDSACHRASADGRVAMVMERTSGRVTPHPPILDRRRPTRRVPGRRARIGPLSHCEIARSDTV